MLKEKPQARKVLSIAFLLPFLLLALVTRNDWLSPNTQAPRFGQVVGGKLVTDKTASRNYQHPRDLEVNTNRSEYVASLFRSNYTWQTRRRRRRDLFCKGELVKQIHHLTFEAIL